MPDSTPKITVVIPYFQRTPGILKATLESVLSQAGSFELSVVVTDDESPVPAESELAGLSCPSKKITIVKQKNAGPGAARNTSLDHLPPNTRYVALLDSDDQWRPGFLETAVAALERGYDIFFTDSKRYAHDETRFEWDTDPALNLRPSEHLLIDNQLNLYEFKGDFFDYIVHRSNILGSSTTVYRHSVAPTLRFDTSLYNGEDRLFKLELCQHVRKAVFTPTIFGIEGKGINIFDSATWGSEKALRRIGSYIELCKKILARVQLAPSQTAYVTLQLAESRYEYALNLLKMMRSGIWPDIGKVAQTLRSDPVTAALLIPNWSRAAFSKLRGNKTA